VLLEGMLYPGSTSDASADFGWRRAWLTGKSVPAVADSPETGYDWGVSGKSELQRSAI